MISKFKEFLKELWKNQVLGYSWLITNMLIIFYMIVYLSFGPAENLPIPGEPLDLYGLSFLLLITFSFFLIFLFISSWFNAFYENLRKKKAYFKLIAINLLFLVISIFIPVVIFIGLYVTAYFIWFALNSVIIILFIRDLSNQISMKLLKSKKIYSIWYVMFWVIGFVLFGYIFINLPWMTFNLFQQMPLLVFPLFIFLLPIIGLILKPKNENRVPITLFSLLIFCYVLYIWFRYLNWNEQAEIFTVTDAFIDIIMLTYIYFSIFKNANKISDKLNNKINYEQILLLLIWTRVSSLILLLTVSDYQLLGISALEGSYLISMFLLIVIGFIFALMWIRRGLIQKEDIK